MKKTFSLLLGLMIITSSQVFAAGSGSGGALPPEPEIKKVDVPEVIEIQPADEEPDAPVQRICADYDDLETRITCRLEKNKEELAEEYQNHYMPEECRPLLGDDQEGCINRYKTLKPCWDESNGPDRIACVKETLGLPENIVAPSEYCEEQECQDQYRQKVYNLITYRFYDAEERAEIWYDQGKLDLETTAEFIAFISESKIAFYQAEDTDDRRDIIEGVQKEWNKLTNKL